MVEAWYFLHSEVSFINPSAPSGTLSTSILLPTLSVFFMMNYEDIS